VEDVGLVLSAFIFGLVASSALVIGAVAGAYWTPPRPLLASALAFAIGAWSATAVVLGNMALSSAGEGALAVLLSFAGGAVLASLADTLMPDAYREGGKWVAFATAVGFLLSFLIAEV
jgi:zinc transporter, ZIP family